MKRIAVFCILLVLVIGLLPPSAAAVSDLVPGSWYYASALEMIEQGLIVGYSDGSFRPAATIPYSQFVTIVARCKGWEVTNSMVGHWASGTMGRALEAGWYDWDEIPPTGELYDQPIPRYMAVKLLMKALAPEVRGAYGDWAHRIADFSSLDGRYYDVVFAAYESGVIIGDESGCFHPRATMGRNAAAVMIHRALSLFPQGLEVAPPPSAGGAVDTVAGGVSDNGKLQVVGTQLCNEAGTPLLLRGMSTHGMQWFPEYASSGSIKTTRDYGANVFRVAMYTGENGYISKPSVKQEVIQAVDAALALDMYVIIDWHILSDGDPNTYVAQSKMFFAEMAERYKDEPGVIYEICNEPNGNVTWEGEIRPYAMEVIPVIRASAPDAVVLVGTGTWSQDVQEVAKAPLPYSNVMYALHFYAGTHGDGLRRNVETALAAGTPVFASEWGTSQATGGGVYAKEADVWLSFLEGNGISWVNWSLCDKNESSAALMPGASASGGWTEAELSESGRYVFSRFK